MIKSPSSIFTTTIGLVLISFLLWHADIAQVINNAGQAMNPRMIYVIAILVVTTLVGAFNAYLFIGWQRNIKFRSFLTVYWLTWAWGLVIPGQIGDILSGSLLMQKFQLEKSTTVGRYGLDKVVSLVMTLVVGVGGITYLFGRNYWEWNVEAVTGIIVVIITAVFLGNYLVTRIRFTPGSLGQRAQDAFKNSANEFTGILIQAPQRVLLNVLLTLIKILLTGLAYWITLNLMGETELPFIAVTSIAMAAGLIAYLPITVNGLGTVEFIAIGLFAGLGAESATVLTAYLVLRLTVLILAWLPAMFIMLHQKKSYT